MEVETVLELWACIYRSLGIASCGTVIGLVPDAQAFLIWWIVYSCCCNISNLVIHSLYVKIFIAMSMRDLWNVGGWDISQTVDTSHINCLQRVQHVFKGTCPYYTRCPRATQGSSTYTLLPFYGMFDLFLPLPQPCPHRRIIPKWTITFYLAWADQPR